MADQKEIGQEKKQINVTTVIIIILLVLLLIGAGFSDIYLWMSIRIRISPSI